MLVKGGQLLAGSWSRGPGARPPGWSQEAGVGCRWAPDAIGVAERRWRALLLAVRVGGNGRRAGRPSTWASPCREMPGGRRDASDAEAHPSTGPGPGAMERVQAGGCWSKARCWADCWMAPAHCRLLWKPPGFCPRLLVIQV